MQSHPLPMNVNPGSRVPVYRQIAGQVAEAIAARTLEPGEDLTPFRELAEMLVISPLAVKKAYEDLMLEGLVRRLDDGRVQVAPEAAEHSRRELAKTLLEEELSLEELQLARSIQCRLLPPSPLVGDGFRVAAKNVPARFVAGDFYDVVLEADGGVGVAVADVAGKGIGPSLIMASVKAVLPFLAAGRSVEATLQALNDRLCSELGPREFVALAFARFDPDTRRLRIANAGLPEPYLLRLGKAPSEVRTTGPRLPLGLRPGLAYEAVELSLLPGERLLLYTDGLPEARTAQGEPLGYERFAELVAATSHLDAVGAELCLEDLFREVRRAARRGDEGSAPALPETLDDDRTALLVESTETRGDG